MWVELEIRDKVTSHITYLSERSGIVVKKLLAIIGLAKTKFHRWLKRTGIANRHNGEIPRAHWLTPEEVEKVENFVSEHYSFNDFFLRDGYRRITYKMIDLDVVAASPSSVYRILKRANLLNKWNTNKRGLKGMGFKQPDGPHKHWHTDIKYVNFRGTFLFLISVIDGFSRYIIHHELRHNMACYDVQLTIQAARDKYPGEKPRIITDNGSQYISKEFKQFIKDIECTHIKTSVNYPQANGKIERFHRSISEECLRIKSPITVEDFRLYIEDYIKFYNTERLHASLNYLTPEDYLLGRQKEKLKVRESKIETAELNRADYWKSVNEAA
ncbi:MAG: DDE-type integrase/transposase/recombinase [Ignavibacteriaceae bacterium]|nr:DDE-type integrase/transposase/recombinase [Ignavibacteriaceae bacterium]